MKRQMKLSFLFAVILTVFLSQSVSAYSGLADSKDYAITRTLGMDYVGKLDSTNDVDWLKYTNTYTFSTIVNIFVMPMNPAVNYDIEVDYCNTTGYCFPVNVADTGFGNTEYAKAINVPPGYTVYWKVKGHNYWDFGFDYATAIHS
ncbi:hypothetical protein ACFFSY_29380 [Paenibacillus aurantiacus]|uniref:Uncharacterized protein n=1 Tax=Paenibacillus aurantiacus TaxID=1936118 RepID=A0ABV5KYR8_9BACL